MVAPLCMAIDWPPAPLSNAGTSASPTQRIEAMEQSAAAMGTDAEAMVLRGIGDPEPSVRLAAAQIAGRFQMRGAVAALTGWLGDARVEARAAAASALGAIGASEPLRSSFVRSATRT